MRTGPEIIYVHPDTAEMLDAPAWRYRGAIADAGDAQPAARPATVPGPPARMPARRMPADRAADRRDVENDRGAVIVPAGRRVTDDDVERARQAGRSRS